MIMIRIEVNDNNDGNSEIHKKIITVRHTITTV